MSLKSDAMLTRYEKEISERSAFIDTIVAKAQDEDRDLNDQEHEWLADAKKAIEIAERNVSSVTDSMAVSMRASRHLDDVNREFAKLTRPSVSSEIEYRSAGAFLVDTYAAWKGDRDARERLEVYNRQAAHDRTTDLEGIIPDPIVGPVIDYIDTRRPLVQALGTSPIVSNIFYRPRVTQHTEVARQTDGTTDDIKEKVELASRKLVIQRDQVDVETYGGYVNVSRQVVDFSSPSGFDFIVRDLAGQYAITTEEVVADAIATTNTSPVPYALNPDQDEIAAAVWEAAGVAYAATGGVGSLFIAVAPDRLGAFGPAFAPYGPFNQQGTGFLAANFGQGPVGTISGLPVYMSAALDSGEAFVISTASIELFEQRGGTLQVVEPSVLGVQIAYYGYFATLIPDDGGIVPLEEGTA